MVNAALKEKYAAMGNMQRAFSPGLEDAWEKVGRRHRRRHHRRPIDDDNRAAFSFRGTRTKGVFPPFGQAHIVVSAHTLCLPQRVASSPPHRVERLPILPTRRAARRRSTVFSRSRLAPSQNDLQDVVYWLRQVFAIVIGLIFGLVPLMGSTGIIGYVAVNWVRRSALPCALAHGHGY